MKMNKFALITVLTYLLSIPAAWPADEEDHSAHHPGTDQSQAAPAQDDKAAAMGMEKMQDKMKKMQELMAKIHTTTDPKERAKLMKEHMDAMRESMKSMQAMMEKGDMMMGKKKPQDSTAAEIATPQHEGDHAAGNPADSQKGGGMMKGGMMMKMHKKMEDRMDAMQKMMEQMIEREAMEQKMEGR